VHDEKWSDREKKVARRVFDSAVQRELAETIVDFKARVADLRGPDEMWALEQYLRERRHEIERKYDFRYSQLIWVFGQLLREGRIQEDDLAGLTEGKINDIRRFAGR
jgi:hypothetical protein